ncbi:MAG: ABC transporter permease [Acidobacteria bacterium]|nr:ABC transporter permease [Acidobacteriota bacterium]
MVNLLETVSIGLRSMRAHPLRSTLTLLGLIIGVATLLTVITLLDGANAYVEEKIIALGSDSFQITKTPPMGIGNFDEYFDALREKDLLMEDAEAIRRGCSDCLEVGAEVTATARLKYGDQAVPDVVLRG